MKSEVATAGVTDPSGMAQMPRSPSGWANATPVPSTRTSTIRNANAPVCGASPAKQIAQERRSPSWTSFGRFAALRSVPAQSWMPFELKLQSVRSTVPATRESAYS